MKLIIAGSSGFVGSETVRQCYEHPKITSVVALARSEIPVPLQEGADRAKLRSVTVNDYSSFSDGVKDEFVGADACIWTVAITPRASREGNIPFEEVKRVNHDSALAGFQAMVDALGDSKKTFRFIYMSGIAAERDQTKTPTFMPEYCLMRGRTENELLALAEKHKHVEVCVAKPGLITAPEREESEKKVLEGNPQFPCVARSALVAAMIDQCIHGIEMEPLLNDDLMRIGHRVASTKSE